MAERRRTRSKRDGGPSLADFERVARSWGALGAAAVTVSVSGGAAIVVAVTNEAGSRLLMADDLGQVYEAMRGAIDDEAPGAAEALGLPAAKEDGAEVGKGRPAPGDRGGWQ